MEATVMMYSASHLYAGIIRWTWRGFKWWRFFFRLRKIWIFICLMYFAVKCSSISITCIIVHFVSSCDIDQENAGKNKQSCIHVQCMSAWSKKLKQTAKNSKAYIPCLYENMYGICCGGSFYFLWRLMESYYSCLLVLNLWKYQALKHSGTTSIISQFDMCSPLRVVWNCVNF